MINRTVFYERLAICQRCKLWRGACTKGHILQGSLGCPLKLFAGVEGAGYQLGLPVAAEPPPVAELTCCGDAQSGGLKPLSWGEVLVHLMQAMRVWRQAGFPIVSAEDYVKRIRICTGCDHYKWFQCQQCQCVVYLKAKLATENCPRGLWL